MKVAITGGKGGTGKSTVATGIAVELAKGNRKVLLVDADVDCPDDHLLLSIRMEKKSQVEKFVPKVDREKCIQCGKCSQACRQNAMVFVKGEYPILVPEQCIGCKACMFACPANAIKESKEEVGTIYSGTGNGIDLVTGELLPGSRESALVVTSMKRFVGEIEKDYDFIITDTSAGTHCPVILSLRGSDLAIAVTEPTPLGTHDLGLILELMKEMQVPGKAVLNKAGMGDDGEVMRILDRYDVDLIATIPYQRKFQEMYSRGKPVRSEGIDRLVSFLEGFRAS
jgi:MinD superfamily P-loop ATPase